MPWLATATADLALKAVFTPGTTYWLSIHSGTPTGGANEASGGGYSRQAIVFGTPVAGVQSSTDAQSITTPTEVSAWPYIGVWTAQTGGTMKWAGDSETGETKIGEGQILYFAAGSVTARWGTAA